MFYFGTPYHNSRGAKAAFAPDFITFSNDFWRDELLPSKGNAGTSFAAKLP
jgi:hypothetical protein